MCIRDSQLPAGQRQELGQIRRVFDLSHQVAGEDEQVRLGAVSYTHLRAHETVLDLVCRLLLEKKKKPNTNA